MGGIDPLSDSTMSPNNQNKKLMKSKWAQKVFFLKGSKSKKSRGSISLSTSYRFFPFSIARVEEEEDCLKIIHRIGIFLSFSDLFTKRRRFCDLLWMEERLAHYCDFHNSY